MDIYGKDEQVGSFRHDPPALRVKCPPLTRLCTARLLISATDKNWNDMRRTENIWPLASTSRTAGLSVQDSGYRIQGLGSRVQYLGVREKGVRCTVWGVGVLGQGLGLGDVGSKV